MHSAVAALIAEGTLSLFGSETWRRRRRRTDRTEVAGDVGSTVVLADASLFGGPRIMSIRTSLLGRSDEVAEVLLVLRRTARRGRGAVVVVTGEAGIGKSALVRTIAPEAARMGFAVGVGKAEEIGQIAPAAPLLLALRSGARPVLSSEAFADLVQVADQPLWLVDRLAATLEDLLTRGPLLLVVDDYHWADRLTRLAVRLLVDRLVGLPVVWLLAARGSAEAVEAELDVPDGSTTVHRLTLGRLADAVINTLATEVLGAGPNPTVRDHLRGAAGNPLVALQYLAGPSGASSSAALPDSLIAAVRARLRSLGPDTRQLIELIAGWGRPATRSEVIEMTPDLPATAVLAAVSEARAADLLDEQAEVLALRHDLVRDAVYLDIPPTVRAARHRRCGSTCSRPGMRWPRPRIWQRRPRWGTSPRSRCCVGRPSRAWHRCRTPRPS